MEYTGVISKLDEDKRLAFGWAYVSHDPTGMVQVDKSGDRCSRIEELEKAAYNFVLESRVAGDYHQRSGSGIGEMVESIVFTPEKIEKMGLPEGSLPLGWWVGYKVHDDDTWAKVKDGTYAMFSIHGGGVRSKVEKSEKEPRRLGSDFRFKELIEDA